LGEVWVVGSGYSNSPVYHSANNGVSWEALNGGLPSCIAEAIATNDDESLIFLATSVGPFVLEASANIWADLSDGVAPLVHYMDVEYMSLTNTVRFATYARGIWDYQLETIISVDENQHNNEWEVFPNPSEDYINIALNNKSISGSYVIYDNAGRVVYTGFLNGNTQQINISNFTSGIYFIKFAKTGEIKKFIRK
jgi:hypothetical protein